MGYDKDRFVKSNKIEKEFICLICRNVIFEPKQINSSCEHIFCAQCISISINKNVFKCPYDRNPIEEPYLMGPSRYWLNNYNKLRIKCYFNKSGCRAVVELEDLNKHESSCEYNPNALVICKEGCAAEISRKELQSHNCIAHLKGVIDKLLLSLPISQLPQFGVSINSEIYSMKNEIRDLKNRMDQVIDRLNESLSKKNIDTSYRPIPPKKPDRLIDLDDTPQPKPRRTDSSTKITYPNLYDPPNFY
jgi:hypothetical protein